ncbi:MAG: transglutaminase-like domain-containing protein [Bacteroidota bacterium]
MKNVALVKELNALVSLVDEPNEEMFSVIKQKILTFGKLAIPILEDTWVDTFSDFGSKRIESIIEEIRQEVLITEFTQWAHGANNDIITGLTILTNYFQHEVIEANYITVFEKLSRDTWLELNDNLTALEKIRVVNHVFYTVYKFTAELEGIAKSDTYFLNKILSSRTGNAMSLGILYIAIAQKLNIPVYGVELPGHFVLVYMDDDGSLRSPDEFNELDVIFYINAAKDGTAFTRNEIVQYIHQMKLDENPDFFMPCTNLAVLKRMIGEFIISLELENKHEKTVALKKLLTEVHQKNNLPESASI